MNLLRSDISWHATFIPGIISAPQIRLADDFLTDSDDESGEAE